MSSSDLASSRSSLALSRAPASAHLPGSLACVPVEPRIPLVVLGVGLLTLAAWMIALWLPSHHPMTPLEAQRFIEDGAAHGVDRSRHWIFAAWLYPWTFVIAGITGCLGLGCVLSGLTHRPFKEVICERCVTRVLARKDRRGLRCPLGAHYARRTPDPFTPFLLTLASLLLLGLVAHLSR